MKRFLNSQSVVWFLVVWAFAWSTWGLFGWIDSQVGDIRLDPDGEHGHE